MAENIKIMITVIQKKQNNMANKFIRTFIEQITIYNEIDFEEEKRK